MARVSEPPLSDDITTASLDPEVRRDLRGLQKDTANSVARHLVAAGMLVDEDPGLALEHARFARTRASRIAVVREAAGITAYHAGEWAEALGELRAARRMGGGPGHLAVMADIERALGRPERALDLSRGPEVRELDRAESIELLIVAAGARRDLGELDAAVISLQVPELDPARRDPWSARLFYAHADNLLASGRESDALEWFVNAANADVDGDTDADLRIAELTGESLPDEDIEFGPEEFDEFGDATEREPGPQDLRREESADADAESGEEPPEDPDRQLEETTAPADEVEAPEESGPASVPPAEQEPKADEGLRDGELAESVDEAEGGADGAAEAEDTAAPPAGSAGEHDAPGEDTVGEAVKGEAGEVPVEGAEPVDPSGDVRDSVRDSRP
ncbi:hypothetical protein [Pseudonocardia yunnanensis]|uniref:TPR-repeat-containing protein n=1 Tax=Pseudonocardia yunnanensis TaxID=58107 RepID=A0ABW4F4F6_9PSEU